MKVPEAVELEFRLLHMSLPSGVAQKVVGEGRCHVQSQQVSATRCQIHCREMSGMLLPTNSTSPIKIFTASALSSA